MKTEWDAGHDCAAKVRDHGVHSETNSAAANRKFSLPRTRRPDRRDSRVSLDLYTVRGPLAYRVSTRCLDVLVSVFALTVFAPLLALIALGVRLDSPGPALFRHQRVGLNRRRHSEPRRKIDERSELEGFGRPFNLYKFRTMYIDARERFPELYAYEYTEEELHTLPIKVLVGSVRGPSGAEYGAELGSDPRLTRFGRWLRRTSLDELPNFLNVLRGDMTLVGPRPDITENIRHYQPQHLIKLAAKPGLTGLAQVKGRGMLSLHKTNELDIEYLRRRSIRFDLAILLETVRVTMRRDGAY